MARRVTVKDWYAEAIERFGADTDAWQVVCPVCKHPQTIAEMKAVGMPEASFAFSCIGRWIPGSKEAFDKTKTGPCTYAGGGLFKLNPVTVVFPDGKEQHAFEWAEPPTSACACGHSVEEHAPTVEYPSSRGCAECDCIAFEVEHV